MFLSKKTSSLKSQMVHALLYLIIPLLLMLEFSSIYSISLSNRKIAESNQRTLSFYVQQLETGLSSIDDLMMSTAASNTSFQRLGVSLSQLDAYLASYDIISSLKNSISAFSSAGAFFLVSTQNDIYRDVFSPHFTFSYPEKQFLHQTVQQLSEENRYQYAHGWVTVTSETESYLFRFYGGRGNYLAAMVPLERSLKLLDQEDFAYQTVFSRLDGTPLTEIDLVTHNKIDLMGAIEAKNHFLITGSPQRFMVLGKGIPSSDCILFLLIGTSGFFNGLNWIQLTLLALSSLSILLIPLSLAWLKRSLLVPLDSISKTINAIRSGDLEAQIPTDCPVQEFRQVNETFNDMIAQIRDLKIQRYEQEIGRQKAELQYLQLQIRPHFFLNCLKCLYAAAQQKKYDRVQQLILSVSNHIRYIFRDKLDLVPLERELEHIQNYIQIQNLSSGNPPVCEMQVLPEVRNFQIPPLSLQTFVENSIKHETRQDHPLKLFVKATILYSDGKPYLDLSVQDNGTGFPEKVLEQINSDDDEIYRENHVGIWNIKQRFRLIYGNDVMFAFYNTFPGSVSEILIPYHPDPPLKGEETIVQ